MAKVPNGVETLPKISIAWVGCTNVTDDRQTDDRRQTDGRTTTYSEHKHEFTFAKKRYGLGGNVPSATDYEVWRSVMSSHSGVRGGVPAANAFLAYLKPTKTLLVRRTVLFCLNKASFFRKKLNSIDEWGREACSLLSLWLRPCIWRWWAK